MNKIENIFIHCSDSKFGDVDLIRKWHINDRKWKDIGYNGVICNGFTSEKSLYKHTYNGLIQEGRSLDFSSFVEDDEVGAHTLGYNANSLGFCLIGVDRFTINQFRSIYHIINVFKRINPDIKILGHYESEKAGGKTCPNIDMDRFRRFVSGEETSYERITDIMNGYLKKHEEQL